MQDTPKRVYIETSVFSGYGRQRFNEPLERLFRMILDGQIIPVISALTLRELYNENTPREVLENLNRIEFFEKYETTEEMQNLVNKYMQKKIVIKKYTDDALHIAIATVLNVDILISWNLSHIVNKYTIPLFNKVNIEEGYNPIKIMKPEEIM